jgi:hypothetical protein
MFPMMMQDSSCPGSGLFELSTLDQVSHQGKKNSQKEDSPFRGREKEFLKSELDSVDFTNARPRSPSPREQKLRVPIFLWKYRAPGTSRVAIFRQKIIPRNTKQDRTDGSSVGILPVSRKRKTSKFRSEPFLGREKPLEFRYKPFSNDKTLEFLSKPFSEKKTLEFRSEPFLEEKKTRNSIPNHFRKRKLLKIHSKPFLGTENTRKMTTFVSCFLKLHYFRGIPFRSVRIGSELRNWLF